MAAFGIGDAITLIEKGILIHKKISKAPGEIRDIKNRMVALEKSLAKLENFVEDPDGLVGKRGL